MPFDVWLTLTVGILGIFAVGHMIGYHRGWQDGYWTEHPPALGEGATE